MRRACVDIGSNTTRLLVADCEDGRVSEVHGERAFTRIGKSLTEGRIAAAKIAEVAAVVRAQALSARRHGAEELLVVATATVRRAANRAQLCAAITESCGLSVRILSEQQEARLAFLGAASMLGRPCSGELGVVDVGGGSTELAVGAAPDRVRWSVSLPVGSGLLHDQCRLGDPPTGAELQVLLHRAYGAFDGIEVPHPTEAVAVGGSATSLRRLAGSRLDAPTLAGVVESVTSAPAAQIAGRLGLDVERVRLLPAGLLILRAASERLGVALEIGNGGLREGVLLDATA